MKYCFLLITFIFLSCKKEVVPVEKKCTSNPKKLEMYQMSEMANLMEQMYAYNSQLKQHIVKGDTIGKFQDFFLKINSATMTDASDNDIFFKTNAKLFIEKQKKIYIDSENLKHNFNEVVDMCLKCHEQKCGGPIPRIKKLYIKE